MTYYNTTSITNPTLSEYKRINTGQDQKILECFRAYRHRKLTPFNVQALCGLNKHVPITSIRRSINTLTDAGYLVKLEEKALGGYGRLNSLWKLKTEL